MRWFEHLTKAERSHVRQWTGALTLTAFRANRKEQRGMADRFYNGDVWKVCRECHDIEHKLKQAGYEI